MVTNAENRKMWLEAYLARVKISLPKADTPEWEIWELLKITTRSPSQERTLCVLLAATYRQSTAYRSAAASRIKAAKAANEKRKARTGHAFDFVGLGIVSGLLDSKTLELKIDSALAVGRMLGLTGSDESVQARGAERMKIHAAATAEKRKRHSECIAEGKHQRSEHARLVEQFRTEGSARSESPDITSPATRERRLPFEE